MQKRDIVILVVGIVLIVLIMPFFKKFLNKSTASTATASQNPFAQLEQQASSSGQLQVQDIKVGDGPEATAGATVTVNYTGTLTNGTKFDSSYDHGQPFTFQLGAGQVIQGWDQGVQGMKVGGERKLTIPPSLGYGNQAAGSIPPNSTLIFDISLLGVK